MSKRHSTNPSVGQLRLRCVGLTVAAVVAILLGSAFHHGAMAADEDPLQDFCVALDPDQQQQAGITINGLLCKNPAQVQASDFASTLLRNPGMLNNALGVAVNLASANNFFGLNTQGLSIARIDFQPNGGLNPPHVHPRATEVLFLAEGTLLVGFVSTTNNTLFQQQLYKGDLFVFPRGLIHFQLNVDKKYPALAISALNSQNPGVSQVAPALFAANPPLPEEVLETAFGIDKDEVYRLISSVAGTLG